MAEEDLYSLLAQAEAHANPPEVPLSGYEKALGYARSVLSGPTFNFGDNLEAALFAPFTDKTYGEELTGIRDEQSRFKRNTDYTDNLTEIAASVFNPLAVYGKLGGASKYALNAERLAPKISAPIENTFAALTNKIPVSDTVNTLFLNPAAQGALSGAGAANGKDVLWNAGLGAGVGTVGSIFANKLGGTLARPGYEADRLMTSAYGVSAPAISRTINKMGNPSQRILEAEGLPIIKSIEKYSRAGLINPEQSLIDRVAALDAHQTSIGNQLTDLLTVADQAIPPIKDFRLATTNKYIDSLSGEARVAATAARNEEYSTLMSQLGEGTLADLQRLKTGLNYKYSANANAYKPDVIKAIRSDLRQEIEDRVDAAAAKGVLPEEFTGQVKAYNREWGDVAELKHIYSSNQGRDFAGDLVSDITSSASTTGGSPMGGSLMMSAITKDPAWGIAGALGKAANLPVAKEKIAKSLREMERLKIVAPVAKTLEELGTARTFEQGFESAYNKEDPYTPPATTASNPQDEILSMLKQIEQHAGVIAGKDSPSFFVQEVKTKEDKKALEPKASAPKTPDSTLQNSASPTAKPMSYDPASLFEPLDRDTVESGTKAGTPVNRLANSVFSKDMQDKSSNKSPEIKAIEAQIDADPYTKTLYEFESSRNPSAKNPNSSASGGFQFIKSTAKAMKLEDPMDLAASYDAVKRLTAENQARFGDDPGLLYSAHYLGATVLKKLQDGDQLTKEEMAQVKTLRDKLLPKFRKMYEANLKNILV